METMFQLIYQHFVSPVYDKKAFDYWKKVKAEYVESFDYASTRAVDAELYKHNQLGTPPLSDILEDVDFEAASKVFSECFSNPAN